MNFKKIITLFWLGCFVKLCSGSLFANTITPLIQDGINRLEASIESSKYPTLIASFQLHTNRNVDLSHKMGF